MLAMGMQNRYEALFQRLRLSFTKKHLRLAIKTIVWGLCLLPMLVLIAYFEEEALTSSMVTGFFGDWTLRILLLSLAMTPLRLMFHWSWPMSLRRLLGLFAFFYSALHITYWLLLHSSIGLVVDHFTTKTAAASLGIAAFFLMIPLAATSTVGSIKRLGAARWRTLHRMVYVIAILSVLHTVWIRGGSWESCTYAILLTFLLGVRAWDSTRRRLATRAVMRQAQREATTPGLILYGNSVNVQGLIEVAHSLSVDCGIKGELRVGGRLVIGKSGIVDGDVKADQAVIHGQLTGTINAKSVLVSETGKLDARVEADSFVVTPGGSFIGTVVDKSIPKTEHILVSERG